jgi:ketosteroid isomerase-like protein
MAESDASLLRAYFDAANRGDWAATMPYLADDVVLLVAFEAPDGGTYTHAGPVSRWFGDWFARFAPGYEMTIEDITRHGDCMLATVRHRGVGRASGVPVQALFYNVFRIADDRIKRIELYTERGAALRAVGLPAEEAAPSRD